MEGERGRKDDKASGEIDGMEPLATVRGGEDGEVLLRIGMTPPLDQAAFEGGEWSVGRDANQLMR